MSYAGEGDYVSKSNVPAVLAFLRFLTVKHYECQIGKMIFGFLAFDLGSVFSVIL